jgi:hypothetical protein
MTFLASKAIMDMVIKKRKNPGHSHHKHVPLTELQQKTLRVAFFYATYEVAMKELENKIVYYQEIVEC